MRSPRRSKLTVSILCLVLLLPSCQQMSLEEETGGSSGTSCASPVGFGEGTAERPFTVGGQGCAVSIAGVGDRLCRGFGLSLA